MDLFPFSAALFPNFGQAVILNFNCLSIDKEESFVLSLVYTPVADCRWQSRGSATVADSRACVYTSAGDCRQRKSATVVSSRRL